MKRFIKRNIKYLLTALLLLVFLCSAIRGIHIRSVSEVRQEAQELAGITETDHPKFQGDGQNAGLDAGTGPGNPVSEASNDETVGLDESVQNQEEGESDAAEQKNVSGDQQSDSSDKQTQAGKNKKASSGKSTTGTDDQTSMGKQSDTGKEKKTSGGKQGSVQKTKKSGKQQTKTSGTTSGKRKISDGKSTKPDQYHTDPVPSGRPEPVNAEDQTVNQKRSFYVYLSIDVKTILDHMDDQKPGLQKYVPEDGWILPKTQVLCYEGETAWDVMSRECKARGINVQSSYTPLYNSVYMEGINHIGEFDCGATAGWVYEVDGWIPNYSSSRYVMVEGEYLRWRYSCVGFGTDLDGAVR